MVYQILQLRECLLIVALIVKMYWQCESPQVNVWCGLLLLLFLIHFKIINIKIFYFIHEDCNCVSTQIEMAGGIF